MVGQQQGNRHALLTHQRSRQVLCNRHTRNMSVDCLARAHKPAANQTVHLH
ncbi:MAG: hypothetical protein AAFQ63_02490 [Cyanobacteria bacterium J06621_11]